MTSDQGTKKFSGWNINVSSEGCESKQEWKLISVADDHPIVDEVLILFLVSRKVMVLLQITI